MVPVTAVFTKKFHNSFVFTGVCLKPKHIRVSEEKSWATLANNERKRDFHQTCLGTLLWLALEASLVMTIWTNTYTGLVWLTPICPLRNKGEMEVEHLNSCGSLEDVSPSRNSNSEYHQLAGCKSSNNYKARERHRIKKKNIILSLITFVLTHSMQQ